MVSPRQAHVGAPVPRELPPQQLLDLVGVAGHVNRESGQGGEQGDVAGGLVRAALGRGVVGGADADEQRADILVAEIELDLLERALDQERRVAVDDRAEAFLCEAGGDADHELLADPDVDHALGMPLPRAGRREGVVADVGQHDGQPRVGVECLRRDPGEALPHALHAHASTSATTACGRPGRASAMARSSASWSHARALAVDQPSLAKRVSTPSGQP